MKFLYRMLSIIIALAAFLGLAFLIATAYGWEKIWEHTHGSPDLGPVVFEELRKTKKPNQALVCPKGLCNEKDQDRASPIYNVGVDELIEAFLKITADEKGLERVDRNDDPRSIRYVARTRLLRFPDTVRIRFFALGADRSTLAIYSQSQIGQSDLGVNLQRLNRWLDKLKDLETPPAE